MTRVLVVDDSQGMRTVLGSSLAAAGYDVETAATGRRAIEKVETADPAVVTMDERLPDLRSVETVDGIMATNPTPILVISEGRESRALEALDSGAVEVLYRPAGSDDVTGLAAEVVEAVDDLVGTRASALALSRATAAAYAAHGDGHLDDAPDRDEERPPTETAREHPTVVVGASTGGPGLVATLFERLPIDLEATLLVVQHMPAEFTGRFADRLDAVSEYDVREATDGDLVSPGEAVVAPGDRHLAVAEADDEGVRVRLEDGARRHGVRPSIDVAMETAAATVEGALCGVVLSGMGRDGAAGIEAVSEAGGRTIAQDEATSPVFGIPCQAIRTGCVDDVVPGESVAEAIVGAVGTDGEIDV